MTSADARLLFEHLGQSALAYMLNATEEQVCSYVESLDASALNSVQRQLVEQLTTIDAQLHSQGHAGMTVSDRWAQYLPRRSAGAPHSIGVHLRSLTGGTVPAAPEHLTKVEATLHQLAVDCYPACLVQGDDSQFRGQRLSIALIDHPLNAQFQAEVRSDKVLTRLFPTESEQSGPKGFAWRSTGSGGTQQLWLFCKDLLGFAWQRAQLDDATPPFEAFAAAAVEGLRIVCDAVAGKLVTIPVRVGLAGVLLPELADGLNIGSATIRRATIVDERHARMTPLDGALTRVKESGEEITINYAGDLVMELPFPYLVDCQEDFAPEGMPAEMAEGRRSMNRLVESVQLGLLLAMYEKNARVQRTWEIMLDPLQFGPSVGWPDINGGPSFTPVQLNKEQAASWATWGNRVFSLRTESIDVAIRRMLQAVGERQAPEDILVDAVIVWENLFGAPTEATLRVTSSLAWLLGTSEGDRRDRQNRYKKIYNFRSKVVHGNPKIDRATLYACSRDAVTISIEALRMVFTQRSELLQEKTSESRSLAILHAGERAENASPA